MYQKPLKCVQKAFAAQAASKLLTNLKMPGMHSIVKRKIGYGDEERASTRSKTCEMVGDNDNSENERRMQDDGLGLEMR